MPQSRRLWSEIPPSLRVTEAQVRARMHPHGGWGADRLRALQHPGCAASVRWPEFPGLFGPCRSAPKPGSQFCGWHAAWATDQPHWHVGRTVGRTIYKGDGDDDLIGIMDSRELAALVVAAVNQYRAP